MDYFQHCTVMQYTYLYIYMQIQANVGYVLPIFGPLNPPRWYDTTI